jgi:hypothetical protein
VQSSATGPKHRARLTNLVGGWLGRCALSSPLHLSLAVCLLSCIARPLSGQTTQLDLPLPSPHYGLHLTADRGTEQAQGDYQVYQLEGSVRIVQGNFTAHAESAVVWLERPASDPASLGLYKAILSLEGAVVVRWAGEHRLQDERWMGRLFASDQPSIAVGQWTPASSPPPLLRWESSQAAVPAVVTVSWDGPAPRLLTPQIDSGGGDPWQAASPNGGWQPEPTSGGGGRLLTDGELPPGGLSLDGWSPSDAGPEQVRSLQPPPIDSTWSGAGGSLGVQPPPMSGAGTTGLATGPTSGWGARSLRLSGRSSVMPQVQTILRPERGDSVVLLTRGVRLRIGGLQSVSATGQSVELGTIDIEADRVVMWTLPLDQAAGGGLSALSQAPVELYLEGNIVFRQGQRVIYADRMYYNVQGDYGTVLSAEMLTPVPKYEGLLRLKADVIQQRSQRELLAYDAALTSSRLGVPRYWLQASQIELGDQRPEAGVGPDGQPLPAPPMAGARTGMEATARSNFVYLGGMPILYWPWMRTNLDRPNFYLNSLGVRNDQIFGNQVYTDWDAYQVFGLDGIDGTSWSVSADYLEKRGPALGTNYRYDGPGWLHGGPVRGELDIWGIRDKGLDFLGADRRDMIPEERNRGRVRFQHRQLFSPDLELTAQLGWISDRNFLEQYFEREWDQLPDANTGLRLRRYWGNHLFDAYGQARLNDFFTETEWLPRLDYYMLGQSVFGERMTYYARHQVGYANQRVASTPTDPKDAATFQLLPWESNSEGLRAATRQELNLPFEFGVMNVVPFIGGEAAYWGEDINGDSLTRLTGQAGVRTSLPMWRSYSGVQSRLFNLDGLAHKVIWKGEFFYADTTRNLDLLPLYDPLDDNSQEHFRRRMIFNTFAGATPAQFDERFYAVRSGMQRYVTAASTEVVEDLMQARVGLNQRWQTRRGRPGQQRILDVIELDTDLILYPKADRDNFGETVGAVNYDFRYHVGDRVTLLSDGYLDAFSNGLRTLSLGGMVSRPGRGNGYLGFTSVEGPISARLLNGTVDYRLSEKWAASGGTTIDLGSTGNTGHALSVTRIGESFLLRVGGFYNSSRDNFSLQFALEPRFLPMGQMRNLAAPMGTQTGLYGM